MAKARRFRRAYPATGPVVHIPLPSGPRCVVESPPIETTPVLPVATVHLGTTVGTCGAGTTITIRGTCTVNTLLGAAYGTAAGSLLGDSISGLTIHESSAVSVGSIYLIANTTANTTYRMSPDEQRCQDQIWTRWNVADEEATDHRVWTQLVAQQQAQLDAYPGPTHLAYAQQFAQAQQFAYAQAQPQYDGGWVVEPPQPSPAEVRARDLLDTVLDAAQRDEMKTHRYFTVIGSTTKRRYRVHVDKGRHGNITEVDAAGVSVRRLCCAPTECPESDALVGQKLFLEMSEEEFVRTANVTDLRNGTVVAGARFIEQGGLLRAG